MTGDYLYSPDWARLLADLVVAARARWRRSDLAAAMAEVLDDAEADGTAHRILQAFPREPVDVRATLAGYLVELRSVSEPLSEPQTGALLAASARTPVLWAGLPVLNTPAELASFLDLTIGELDWFADHGNWLRSHRGPLQHYRQRRIAKRSGLRLLEIPKPRLREIQRKLLRTLVSVIEPHPAAHGFRPGRDARSFAAPHAGGPIVLRVDLRDFFASVPGARIRAVFVAVGYPPPIAALLADLCTTATPIAALCGLDPAIAGLLRGRHLPQGASTSPALSNLVLRNTDRRIAGYVARHGLRYTRYADDLAVSGSGFDPAAVRWVIEKIVTDEGFRLHPDKTSVMRSHQRQRLASLVINTRPQVNRSEYDALRALLHNAASTGAAAQNRGGHEHFREHVFGRIGWAGASNPDRRRVLLGLAERVDWSR
ncbi:reverse transcriptase family protein [Nakamurella lactea]|uniref:reverse transcriptase family protein n=1 Tax=Nakamurella lactea TaxID=459515 RepID=UPI000402D2B9|nr:reverse transcriptase family protein [Nakamurella lactea]